MRRRQANLDYRVRARRERAAQRLRAYIDMPSVHPHVDKSPSQRELARLEAKLS